MSETTPKFEDPVYVANPKGCFFYHSMDLPEWGFQPGKWDIRDDVDNYLGNLDFKGRTVIDVGTASGFLAFEMEKRGANVIAFDRELADRSDDFGLVPFHDFEERFGVSFEQAVERRLVMQSELRNSFWLAHRLLQSKVRLYPGNVYSGVTGIATVDYCLFGCILLHLRDPLRALSAFAPVVRDKVIITDNLEPVGRVGKKPVQWLRPNIMDDTNSGTWWYLTPAVLRQFLEILGFKEFTLNTHQAFSVEAGKLEKFYTLVGSR